jgi:uncharacterized membrane protein YtjA (UPF0391 family)
MIRWALVAFVIAVICAILDFSGRGPASAFAGDVSIAAFMFAAISSVIAWISRNQMDEDTHVGKPWSP